MKKALLIVSFGTTYPKARQAISQLEDYLAGQFPDYTPVRAFTSGRVIAKIKREEGVEIPTPEQALAQLAEQGYDQVLCQTLHIIPGFEYDKMCRQLRAFRGQFHSLRLGKPMLFSQEDYRFCAQQLIQSLPALKPDEAVVLMGHGTEHFANAAFSQMENMFYFLGQPRIFMGTVEGFPGMDYLLMRLGDAGVKKVWLAPFMITAGDHALHDMGGDEEDSWKSVLQRSGYEVELIFRGLGEIPPFGHLFARHLVQAEEVEG